MIITIFPVERWGVGVGREGMNIFPHCVNSGNIQGILILIRRGKGGGGGGEIGWSHKPSIF